MESALRDLVDSYKSGLENSMKTLPQDNTVVLEAKAWIQEAEEIASKNGTFMEFMEIAKAKDLFTKMISIQSKLSFASVQQNKKDPSKTKIPSPQEIAIGYHNAYNSIPKEHRSKEVEEVYGKVFSAEKKSKSGSEFIAILEEEDLFLGMSKVHLASVMRDGLSKMIQAGSDFTASGKGVVSNPQMEKYFQQMEKSMESASSLIQLELTAISEAENSRFSNLWDIGFINSILLELISPISAWRMAKTESNRANVETSYRFLTAFWGLDWEGFFQITRVKDYFEKTIFTATESSLKEQGIHSALELKNELKKCLDECIRGKSILVQEDTSKHRVNFRGEIIPLSGVMDALKNARL
jgi:hypothetical protein